MLSDDPAYLGFYIGVQEMGPNEEVNAYSISDEDTRAGELAEAYYLEMLNEGMDDEEATERAWAMALTRTAPSANDWPRSTKPTGPAPVPANPITVTNPTKPVAPAKHSSVPEIDMTTKEPAARFRFSSDIEELTNVDNEIERIMNSVKVEIGLNELMALSPAMRKRVSEMTKTKRVPIEVAKKALVVQETVDDTMYVSMPYTYAEAAGRTPKYSAALPRVQAEIAGASATGMMDTGSQINLMTEEFWMKTGLPINESKKIKMQGVNLTGDQSIGLCEFVEVPFAGVTTLAHFHVFRKAPYPFILGQPWIQDHLIATTETGNTFKVLIRDFKDARNRVTMVLRNEPTAAVRGDAPTVIEYAPNPSIRSPSQTSRKASPEHTSRTSSRSKRDPRTHEALSRPTQAPNVLGGSSES